MQQSTPDARGHAAPRGAPAGGSVAVVVVSLVGVEFRLHGHWSVRLSTSNCTHGHVHDRPRRRVVLTKERWEHIRSEHATRHVGDPANAVDAIGTEEGDGTFHAADGSLIGLTILSAKLRLEEDGKLELTLPERTLVVTDLGSILD